MNRTALRHISLVLAGIVPALLPCYGINSATMAFAGEHLGKSFGDPDKIDVLVVTGGLGIDRDQFFDIFDDCRDIKCVEFPLKDESEVFEDISDWKYDVLVLYNATEKISQKRRDNFVSLLKDQGVGLVVVHHAQAAFQSWHEFHKINGSAFIPSSTRSAHHRASKSHALGPSRKSRVNHRITRTTWVCSSPMTSTNYPTYWHARGYGLFTANPLGQSAFEKSRNVENPQPFHLTLKKGETAPFRFRVILYDGSRTKQQLDNEFQTYRR